MTRYDQKIINQVRFLRSKGKTYGEIRQEIGLNIPKSSLSWQCKNVVLPKEYADRVKYLNNTSLEKGRYMATEMNRYKKELFFRAIKQTNTPIARLIREVNIGKVALAMLCLGEASKYNPKSRKTFSLGNTDPRIILLFLGLLQKCYSFNLEKVRATVQCRADQDPIELKRYWQEVTKIPERLFYKPLIDPRTIGKPTQKLNYKGVLRIDYFDTKLQLELESLADLIYNQVRSNGPVA